MSGSKIKSFAQLRKIIPGLKTKGKKIVFTNGCFDILHYGHIQYLEKAKSKGDILVIAVNSDRSIKNIKGPGRPIIKQADRLKVLAALEAADYVTLFQENTPLKVILALKPDILIKGADWSKNKIIGADYVTKQGGKVYTIKMAKGRSTTNLIKKIAKTFCKPH